MFRKRVKIPAGGEVRFPDRCHRCDIPDPETSVTATRDLPESEPRWILTLLLPFGIWTKGHKPRARRVVVPACLECAELQRTADKIDRFCLGIRIFTATAWAVHWAYTTPHPAGLHVEFVRLIIIVSLVVLVAEKSVRWLQRPSFDLVLEERHDTFVFKNRRYASRFADANPS